MENGDTEISGAGNNGEQAVSQIDESIRTNSQKPEETISSLSQQPAEASETGLPPHLQVQQQQDGGDIGVIETNDVKEAENPEEPRLNALLLKGVNSLDTRAIKYYIDHYVRPDYSFKNKEKYAKFNYKLEWVNDESVNIVFTSREEADEGAQEALQILTDESIEQSEALSTTDERVAKPFVREADEGKKNDKEGDDEMDDDAANSVQLSIRQSLKGDRKVKNARVYSRYYLLHGEPDRAERMPGARERRGRGYSYEPRGASGRGEDLITGEKLGDEELLGDRVKSFRPIAAQADVYRPGRDDRGDDLFSDRERRDRYRDVDDMDVDYRDRRYGDDRSRDRGYRDDRGYREDRFRDTWRPSDERESRSERRRRRRRERGRERGDLFDPYRTSRDEERSRRDKADEEDLFPDFFKNK